MFTFKNVPPSRGLSAIGEADQAEVKVRKINCGTISNGGYRSACRDGKYFVSLQIVDETKKCGFRWVTLTKRTDSKNEMKEWLKKNYEAIAAKYQLYIKED